MYLLQLGECTHILIVSIWSIFLHEQPSTLMDAVTPYVQTFGTNFCINISPRIWTQPYSYDWTFSIILFTRALFTLMWVQSHLSYFIKKISWNKIWKQLKTNTHCTSRALLAQFLVLSISTLTSGLVAWQTHWSFLTQFHIMCIIGLTIEIKYL